MSCVAKGICVVNVARVCFIVALTLCCLVLVKVCFRVWTCLKYKYPARYGA